MCGDFVLPRARLRVHTTVADRPLTDLAFRVGGGRWRAAAGGRARAAAPQAAAAAVSAVVGLRPTSAASAVDPRWWSSSVGEIPRPDP